MGTASPPVSTVPCPSLVNGFGMTSLLAPSVAEPISTSVAQPVRPEVTLPAATCATDVAPSEDMTIALAPESSPLLSRTLEFDTPSGSKPRFELAERSVLGGRCPVEFSEKL